MSTEEILLVKELASDNFRGRGKGTTKGQVSPLHQKSQQRTWNLSYIRF